MPTSAQPGPEAHHRIAGVWLLRGRQDLAAAAFGKALELDPGFVPSCLELSDLLLQQAKYDEALSCCKRALDQNPDNRLLGDQIRKIEQSQQPEPEPTAPPEAASTPRDDPSDDDRTTILVYTDCAGQDGAEQCSHLIMLDLAEAGYRVVCAQPIADHPMIRERESAGIRHHWIETEDLYHQPSTPGLSQNESRELFERTKPELVLFSDGSPFSSLKAKFAAHESGTPFLVLNHCVNEDWIRELDHLLDDLHKTLEAAVEIVSVSQQNLIDLRSLFGLSPDKGKVIYNGRPELFFKQSTAADRKRVRESLNIPEDAVVCISVARFEVMKGYQYLIEAMKHLKDGPSWPKLRFVWIGSGTLENRFRSIVAELGLDQSVHFLGQRSDVGDLLGASDIFALPSQYEGMPLSIMEAMAKGLPVIASRVSGIPEALGPTGQLIANPREHPDLAAREIADALEAWVPRIQRGESLGTDARQRAREHFHSDAMLSSYRELIASVVDAHPSPVTPDNPSTR